MFVRVCMGLYLRLLLMLAAASTTTPLSFIHVSGEQIGDGETMQRDYDVIFGAAEKEYNYSLV